MSGLVERLAEKIARECAKGAWPVGDKDEARWWLNAIADELAGPNTPWDGMRSAEFLRSQATEGDENG